MTISHKIELNPNNKQMTYFRRACGCARLAYNWGLAKWQEYYKEGKKVSHFNLKKEFNAIKKEQFPFVYEVSKYATQSPFRNLGSAFNKFFRDLKKGQVSYPKFKKKSLNKGSFYLGGDQVRFEKNNSKKVKIPLLGAVRMREELRFNGKINNAVISEDAGKWFIAFSIEMEEKKCANLNNNLKVGIDLGLTSLATLSNGLKIKAPKPLKFSQRKLTRLSRQLSKKQHPKTKGDKTVKSHNYMKFAKKVAKLHYKIKNIRKDYTHKLTTMIVKSFQYIALETLNTKGMMQNHKLAKSLSDVSFFELCRQIEYKAKISRNTVLRVDTWYPSSKTCSGCGNVKDSLSLKERIYVCDVCQLQIDRDLNASLNLQNEIKIPTARGKFTLVEKTALLEQALRQNLVTSFVETGI